MKKTISFFSFLFLFGLIIISCAGDDNFFAPKPRGYFRLSLPEKDYKLFDTVFPFSFEIPEYALVEPDTAGYNGEYWFNVSFPQFKGRIHCSYKKVRDNLYQLTEDAHTFVYKHVPKAEDIFAENISFPDKNVFALLYHIEGPEAASSLQFYITDSTSHFLRGALYFEHIPNNDSIQPVIDFIEKDVNHLISTFNWK